MRIGLLNNLRAGRSDKQVSRLLRFLNRYTDVVNVETDSAKVVPEALSEMARREVELLVVNGGDGTLQHALTEVLANRAFDGPTPIIAPLRGGRTNQSALDLGAHRDPLKGLAGIIDAVSAGTLESRIEERRVLRVDIGGGEVLNGMFFGGGMIARAIKLNHNIFEERPGQGVPGATAVTALLLARSAFGNSKGILAPNKADIFVDGEQLSPNPYLMLISSTLTRLFARMRPFWGTEPGPVRFTAIQSDAYRMGRAFPGILRGRPLPLVTPENGYTSVNATQIDMRLDCGFTVDGELVDPTPDRVVRLTAHDRLRFVRA